VPATAILTLTSTTTISSSIVSVIVTVLQTVFAEGLTTSSVSGVVAQQTVTRVVTEAPKVPATTDATTSGGLPPASLVGIIIGPLLAALTIIGVAWLLWRKFGNRKHSTVATVDQSDSVIPPHRPAPRRFGDLSFLPLMTESPVVEPSGVTRISQPLAAYLSGEENSTSTPRSHQFGSPHFSNNGYEQVPHGEAGYFHRPGHQRTSSDESQGFIPGYVDVRHSSFSDTSAALRDQNLWNGHRPSMNTHDRHWSDSSNGSRQSGSNLIELDATPPLK
jgi:hypothetical protein